MGRDWVENETAGRKAASREQVRRRVREGLEVLRRGRWVAMTIASVVIAATVLHVLFGMPPPSYTARTLLLVESPSAKGDDESLQSGFIDGSALRATNLANQVLILQQSETIAQRTAERLRALAANEDHIHPLPTLYVDGHMRSADALAQYLQRNSIAVYQAEEETDAMWITATSVDPREAALMANAYAQQYVDRTLETSRQRITGSRDFLERQVEARRFELQEIEERLKRLAGQGAVALDGETERTIQQIADLEAMLDETKVEAQMRRAALASVEREMNDLQPKLARRITSDTDQEIDLVQKKLARLELLLHQAQSRGTSSLDDIRDLEAQILDLRGYLSTLSEQYVDDMLETRGIDARDDARGYIVQLHRQSVAERTALSGLEAKAEALDKRMNTYEAKLDAIPEQSMLLAQAQRAQRATEELYNRLVQRLQEVQIAEESEIGTARVVRAATAPSAPDSNDTRTMMLMGITLAFLLGGLAAIVRYKLDVRVYTPEDLSDRTAPLLNVIPPFDRLKKESFGGAASVDVDGRTVSTSLPVLLAPFSPEAEAYRKLYVILQFSCPNVVLQTVVVTSAEKGTGKSTTSANLAITAAQTGRRTLLIDADLRHPQVHTLVGTTEGPSLETLLKAETKSFDLDRGTYRTGIENLWAITTPKPAKEPSRLLRSARMRSLLRSFRQHFDVIVIDTPPVLVASEGVIMSTQSDATVMVARSGQTAGDALDQAMEELTSVGAPLVGVVLNGFDPTYVFGYASTYKYSYRGYEYGPKPATEVRPS